MENISKVFDLTYFNSVTGHYVKIKTGNEKEQKIRDYYNNQTKEG